jgi:type IV secretion system protein VirD4
MSQYLDYPIIGDPSPEAIEFGRLVQGRTITGKMRYGGDRHMLVIGGNRSGKGTRILMPNLLNMSGSRSIVVVDPKGELAAVTAQFRRSLGQRVVIINPFGVMTEFQGYDDLEGVGYNPLCALDPTAHDFNAKASLLAEAMISVDPKNQNKHFDYAGRALLAATMMYVAIIAREKRAVPTMKHVRQLICMASEPARPPSALFPDGTEAYGIPKLAAKMMTSSIAALRNKAAPFTDWNREIQSVASTVRTQTECFDDYEIAENLAKNDFDFREIKRQPTTVYLVLPPDQMRRHSGWLRLLLTSALQAALRPRQWGEPSILFMMDEFAALGHLEIIENAWAQVPGYGIQMMPVIQDLNQLKNLYGDRWESFAANAGVITSFAPNDPTTAEWLSKRMGQTTRMMRTVNTSYGQNAGNNRGTTNNPNGGGGSSQGNSDGWSQSKNMNETPIKVPFMPPELLYGMKTGYMVVISAGLSNAAPSFAHAYYKITTRDQRARPNPYVHDVPRDPYARRMGAGEPTWDWGQPQHPQQPPSVGGWGGTTDSGWNTGGGFNSSPAPSGGWQPSPWSSRPALPSPPAQRRLPPPEDWDNWEDKNF